jgi:hypothetical protein
MPGIPDVLLCDEQGRFHFVELKSTGGNAVDLRPHQVAFMSRHAHASVWILVRKVRTETLPQRIYLYRAESSMDLKLHGLKVPPVFFVEGDPPWEDLFGLIAPI